MIDNETVFPKGAEVYVKLSKVQVGRTRERQERTPAATRSDLPWQKKLSRFEATLMSARALRKPAEPPSPPASVQQLERRSAPSRAAAKAQLSVARLARARAPVSKLFGKVKKFESIPKHGWIFGWRILWKLLYSLLLQLPNVIILPGLFGSGLANNSFSTAGRVSPQHVRLLLFSQLPYFAVAPRLNVLSTSMLFFFSVMPIDDRNPRAISCNSQATGFRPFAPALHCVALQERTGSSKLRDRTSFVRPRDGVLQVPWLFAPLRFGPYSSRPASARCALPAQSAALGRECDSPRFACSVAALALSACAARFRSGIWTEIPALYPV